MSTTTTAKPSATEQAAAFMKACRDGNWTPSIRESVVSIHRRIIPGDNASFVDADMAYWSVLSLAPLKGGSIWGTDGGGIGGYAAMRSGDFVMSKSGSGAKFLAALAKLIAAGR